MAPNPCCCMSLQGGVNIMAIIDIILDILNILSVAFAIVAFVALKDDNNHDRYNNIATDAQLNVGIGVLVVMLVIAILGLLLSLRLYYGAKRRDIRNCKIWLIMTGIILTITIILNIVSVFAGDINTVNMVSSIISILYRLYMMWVVFAFIQELKSEGAMMGFQSRLEDGIGYTMQSYPQPQPQPGGGVVNVNLNMYPTSAPPYPEQQVIHPGGPQPTTNTLYNPNNQYNNSGYL